MSLTLRYLIAVIIMALVTYIPRALPFAVFSKQIKSRFIKSFLFYVPYAVLASLTFPAIFYCTDNMIAAVVGTVVALVLAYFEQSLVVVAACAVLSIFLVNLL
ncbi:MAG: AzlD domain-containing protein [Lachnospiraceae bacterium]|nr:AzlD domain-containing protein [Lachnospiraceae bacterium]